MELGLTNREKQIVKLVHEGLTNKEIAKELFISDFTVKSHLHNMFTKFRVDNRVRLLRAIEESEKE